MTEYTFTKTVTMSPKYGPGIVVDACSDGTIWIRSRGNGLNVDACFTTLQARAIADGISEAIKEAMATGLST